MCPFTCSRHGKEIADNAEILESLETNMDRAFNEVKGSLESLQEAAMTVDNKLEVMLTMQEKLADIGSKNIFRKELSDIFQCKFCTELSKPAIVSMCCGQVVGCGQCVQHWLSEHDTCILCKADNFLNKQTHMKCFDELLIKLKLV